MKKTKHGGKDGNVIRLPKLEKRLIDKGQDCLEREQYLEAVSLFQEAIHLDAANVEGYFGLVTAYYGAGNYKAALEIAKMMLHEGIGQYFDIMDLYIKLLFQVQHYTEIVTAIESLLEESVIPGERLEHYYSMLDISRQLMEQMNERKTEDQADLEEIEGSLHLSDYTDPQEQIMLAAKLSRINIQPHLKEIIAYLQSEKSEAGVSAATDSFFKTLLMNVLKEHQVGQSVEVRKFGRLMTVIPKQLPDVNEHLELKRIIELIGAQLENNDPTLFENIKMLIHRQFFLVYPFPLSGPELSAWASAYHALGLEYFGDSQEKDDIMRRYNIPEAEFSQADAFIRMIEEISSPII
nr:tetratricopeptide repeat protein [uncultured Bacillus sp.]